MISTKKIGRFTVTTASPVDVKSHIQPTERKDTNRRRNTNASDIVHYYGIETPTMRCVKFTRSNVQHWANTHPEFPIFETRNECEQHAKEEMNIARLVQRHMESTSQNQQRLESMEHILTNKQQAMAARMAKYSRDSRLEAIRKATIRHMQYKRPADVVVRARTAQVPPGKTFQWRNQAPLFKKGSLSDYKLYQKDQTELPPDTVAKLNLSKAPKKPALKKNATK